MNFSTIKATPYHGDTTSSLVLSSRHRIKQFVIFLSFGLLLPTTNGLVTPSNRADAKLPTVLLFATKSNEEERNRREILKSALATPLSIVCSGFIVAPPASKAVENIQIDKPNTESTTQRKKIPKKPFASLEALLPAARVKYNIDKSAKLTKEILILFGNDEKESSSTTAATARIRKEQIISTLDHLLLDPKNYMMPLQPPTGDTTTGVDTSSPPPAATSITTTTEKGNSKVKLKSGSKLYQRLYADKIKSLPLTDIPGALLTQAGDYRQFSLLQNRQRALEGQSPIRAALNYYTRQLQFDTEFYLLTANAEDKRKMIRNDALPDIKSVIVSDLDLRDLIRNQILDGWDDCQAEFRYQVRRSSSGDNGGETFDAEELNSLLLKLQGRCDEWFAFISETDTAQAMGVIFKEDGNHL